MNDMNTKHTEYSDHNQILLTFAVAFAHTAVQMCVQKRFQSIEFMAFENNKITASFARILTM